jgi:small-conductance mechanosensitive channel
MNEDLLGNTEATGQIFQHINFGRLLLAIAIIAIAAWGARQLTRSAEQWSQRYIRHRHILMNGTGVLRFIIYIIAIILATSTLLAFNKDALLAAGAASALGISFAFQDLIKSFIGGITLLFDRPFQVGDRVQFKEYYGDIVEIGLRSVRLRTLEDNLVSIPNMLFMTEAVASANAGELDMQVEINFYIDPNSSFAMAKQIVYEAVVTSKYAYLSKPVVVLVEEKIVDVVFTLHVIAKAYVFNTRYEKLFVTDVTERVKEAFRERGIQSAMTNPDDARLPSEVAA